MVAAQRKPELIAIVGPTASGKSDLAFKVAKQYGGEIIAADSRTVYKGMDIGTAKPSPAEREAVRHWGLDLVQPGGSYNAQKFKQYAAAAVEDIKKRGKLPILVGGTGLYVDSVLYDFEFRPKAEPGIREKLESMGLEELQALISRKGYAMPNNSKNRRHLIRTIETAGKIGKKQPKPLKNTLIIGIMPPDEKLRENIHRRVEKMFSDGLVEETRRLLKEYGEVILPSAGIAYRIIAEHLAGKTGLEETKKRFKQQDWQYARRQRTWFRRNKFIQWFPDKQSALNYIQEVFEPST